MGRRLNLKIKVIPILVLTEIFPSVHETWYLRILKKVLGIILSDFSCFTSWNKKNCLVLLDVHLYTAHLLIRISWTCGEGTCGFLSSSIGQRFVLTDLSACADVPTCDMAGGSTPGCELIAQLVVQLLSLRLQIDFVEKCHIWNCYLLSSRDGCFLESSHLIHRKITRKQSNKINLF